MNIASVQAALFDSLLPATFATFTPATAAENAGTAFLSLFAAFTEQDGGTFAGDSRVRYAPRGEDRKASDSQERNCPETQLLVADPQNAPPPLPVFSFPLPIAFPPESRPEAEVERLAAVPSTSVSAENSEAEELVYPAGLPEETRFSGASTERGGGQIPVRALAPQCVLFAGEFGPVEAAAWSEAKGPGHDTAAIHDPQFDSEELRFPDALLADARRVKRERPPTDPAAVVTVAVGQGPETAPAVSRVEPEIAGAAGPEAPAPDAPAPQAVVARESVDVTAVHFAGAKKMYAASVAPLAFAARIQGRGRDEVRATVQQHGFARTPVESELPGIAGDVIPRVQFEPPVDRPESPRVPVPQPTIESERPAQPDAALDGAGRRSPQETSAVTSREFVPQDNSENALPKDEPAALEKPAFKREEPVAKGARTTAKEAEAPPAFANESRTPTQPVRHSTDAPATPRAIKTVPEPEAAPHTIANAHVSASRAPAREISMSVTAPESSDVKVDIKLVDRAGSVRVAVRTADAGVAETLQSGLTELVHRLEHKGFEAETWSPVRDSSRNSVNQPHQSGDAAQDSGRGARESSQREHEGQQGGGRNRPRWVAELEQSLEGRR